jgi:predicted ferric reductase
MFVFIGVLSLPIFRRKQFELFYYAHHFFLAVFIVVLWHATTSWCYILGGLVLYVFDRMIRFTRACSVVMLQELKVESDQNVVKLSYLIESGGSGPWSGKFTPLTHEIGQYCFINVPKISPFQWHPFTISSSPNDRVTTHHIKSMGSNTWTSELVHLAHSYDTESRLNELIINVDGPYGLPIDFSHYQSITFIGGGIGITPLISSYSYLYSLAKTTQFPSSLEHVKLIWIVKDPRLFSSFQDIFATVSSDSCSGKFSFDLYCTTKDSESAAGPGVPGFKPGRPNLHAGLAALGRYGMNALVFACGPEQLLSDCGNITMQFGIDFHAETFEL